MNGNESNYREAYEPNVLEELQITLNSDVCQHRERYDLHEGTCDLKYKQSAKVASFYAPTSIFFMYHLLLLPLTLGLLMTV